MSTTVSYKGNTIATLDNETKTLTTKGTWLEDDIEITDESSGGEVLIVDTPDANGGTIREITTGNTVKLEGAKTVAPSSTQQTITPSQGYSGFSSVVVKGGVYSLEDICSSNISGDITLSSTITTIKPCLFSEAEITSFSANGVTTVDINAFSNCTNLETVNFPALVTVGNDAFLNCSNLETFSAPLATNFGDRAFKNCTKLTSVTCSNNISKLSAPCLFQYCNSLKSVNNNVFPNVNTRIGDAVFGDCDFEYFDFGINVVSIGAWCFSRSHNLDLLILRRTDVVVSLSNTNAFSSTPFLQGGLGGGTGGILYVPQSLISSYQSATNWSTILSYENNQILPIEGSIYETQYADGTPIND